MGSAALSSSTSTPTSISPSSTITMGKASSAVASFISNSPLRENALSDISDMLRNLTESHASKSSTPTSLSERSDIDGSMPEKQRRSLPLRNERAGSPTGILSIYLSCRHSLPPVCGKRVMASTLCRTSVHRSACIFPASLASQWPPSATGWPTSNTSWGGQVAQSSWKI